MTAPYLELNDKLRWLLTGERVQVVEQTCETYTLRWPSGDRISYKVTDSIWRYFELCERAH